MNLTPVLWLYSGIVRCKLGLEYVVFETCRLEDALVWQRKRTNTHAKWCCSMAFGEDSCCCRKSRAEREADRRAWFNTSEDLFGM